MQTWLRRRQPTCACSCPWQLRILLCNSKLHLVVPCPSLTNNGRWPIIWAGKHFSYTADHLVLLPYNVTKWTCALPQPWSIVDFRRWHSFQPCLISVTNSCNLQPMSQLCHVHQTQLTACCRCSRLSSRNYQQCHRPDSLHGVAICCCRVGLDRHTRGSISNYIQQLQSAGEAHKGKVACGDFREVVEALSGQKFNGLVVPSRVVMDKWKAVSPNLKWATARLTHLATRIPYEELVAMSKDNWVGEVAFRALIDNMMTSGNKVTRVVC